MKLFCSIIILIFIQSCSFDNKSGIWKGENIKNEKNEPFKEFQTLSSTNVLFDKQITADKDFKLNKINLINNSEWKDIFYDKTNNYKNFKYNDSNQLIFKSKKLTRYKLNNFILFENNNLIVNDFKGNIIVYSVSKSKVISKFNFYKKKYKKIDKILNHIVEDNVIYISDNIGYLYAFDYVRNKILWAKNFKIPFSSNLKLFGDKLIASNQNNNLFFIDKKNGDSLKLIPTEEIAIKNQFINNLSLNNKSLLFLNTYGSLYSFDKESLRINWFINLNQSLDLNPSNLFFGNQIVSDEEKIIVSSNNFTYVIDLISGSIIYKINAPSKIKPIILDNNLFLITKNNLLISLNLRNAKINYSYDINQQIAELLDTKKKKVKFKTMMLANNKIFVFLKNSYILKYNLNGTLEKINKLPTKIKSQPLFIDNFLMYINVKNKLSIVD